MATLVNTQIKASTYLREHHVFGRFADQVDTVIEGTTVSRLHAAFEWRTEKWFIKDLSTNGTWLNGRRLVAGDQAELTLGDVITFGELQNPAYYFADSSPPISMLLPVDSDQPSVSLGVITKFPPDSATPSHTIRYSMSRQSWICDEINSPLIGQPLTHNQVLTLNDQQWRVFLAETAATTDPYQSGEPRLI